MGTILLTTAAERAQALLQLEAAFGQVSGSMEFTYLGSVYQSLGINSDGTLRVLDLSTGQIVSLDPVDVYEAGLAAQGDSLPSSASNDYTKVTPPAVPIVQQIMSQAGMFVSFINVLRQSLGKWAASALKQINAAAASAGTLEVTPSGAVIAPLGYTAPPSSFKTLLNTILNNPYLKTGLSIAGIVLSTYSIWTGIQSMFKYGPTAKGSLGILGGAMGVATSVNTLLGTAGMATLTNPAGWAAAGVVVGGAILLNGIQSMLKNGASVGGVAATTGGFVMMAAATNALVSGLVTALLAHTASVAMANFVTAVATGNIMAMASSGMTAATAAATSTAATASSSAFSLSSLLNPTGFLAAGAFVAGTFLVYSINSMFTNGVSAGRMAEAIGTFAATAILSSMAAAAIIATVAAMLTGAGAAAAASAAWSAAVTNMWNPAGLCIAGVIVASVVMYHGINSMISNGITVGAMAETIGSFVAIAVLANLAIDFITALVLHAAVVLTPFGPVGWIIAGVIALCCILWSIFHQPPPETKAAMSLNKALTPIIYTAGPLLMVAVGTTAALMGWPRSGNKPVMSGLTVPAYYATHVLAANGVSLSLTGNTPTVLVEPGTATTPEKIDIVTPTGNTDSQGNTMVNLESFVLSGNLQFASAQCIPQDAYIPLFTYNNSGGVNYTPAFTAAIENEQELLRAVLSGALTMQGAQSAVQLASAASHPCVSPAN